MPPPPLRLLLLLLWALCLPIAGAQPEADRPVVLAQDQPDAPPAARAAALALAPTYHLYDSSVFVGSCAAVWEAAGGPPSPPRG